MSSEPEELPEVMGKQGPDLLGVKDYLHLLTMIRGSEATWIQLQRLRAL